MTRETTRTAAIIASFLVAGLLGYQPLVGHRMDESDKRQAEISAQMDEFIQAKKLAVNADAYRQQAAELPTCDLPSRLDGKSYDRIARTAVDNGLQVVSLEVGNTRSVNEFFAWEAPAELRLAGEYHQFGRFFEAQAVGPDLAIVGAMKIERSEGNRLALTARVELVRLATNAGQAAGEKANAPTRKGGK